MSETFCWLDHEPLPKKFLERLGGVLRNGGVMVYPTNTLYGLGAGIRSDDGIRLVNEIKRRPAGMPLSIMANASQIRALCRVPDIALPFLDSADMRTTAILPALDGAPPALVHNGTLAVRLPCSNLTASMIEALGPVTATSANVHGMSPPADIEGAVSQLGERVSIYINAGKLAGKPTALVDYTGERPKIIREGGLSGTEGEKGNER